MDWKSEAVDKLKQYEAKRQSLEIIPMQLAEVESAMSSIRSSRTDAVSVVGGGGKKDDRLLSCIVQKEELQRNLGRAQLWVDEVSRALGILKPEERKILERMYIIGDRYAVEDLASELIIDTKTVYRRKDSALRKFTIALYGVVES